MTAQDKRRQEERLEAELRAIMGPEPTRQFPWSFVVGVMIFSGSVAALIAIWVT